MKCGNLNFLEPSGILQACNGTALRVNLNSKLGKVHYKYLTKLPYSPLPLLCSSGRMKNVNKIRI